MLNRAFRMRRSEDFGETVRSGSRAGCETVVVHAKLQDAHVPTGARIGFIVSKSVGTAVVRNRVRRRLRHLVLIWTDELDPRSQVVVRALPAAAFAPVGQLRADLESCLRRALQKAGRRVSA